MFRMLRWMRLKTSLAKPILGRKRIVHSAAFGDGDRCRFQKL
jgi:hypothetical protein